MFKINNNDFIILNKYKKFMRNLEDSLENVPRKDWYYKDKIKEACIHILDNILKCEYDKQSFFEYKINIKSNIALIDFILDRFYDKKYIAENTLYKITNELIEINKIVTSWLNNMEKYENSI